VQYQILVHFYCSLIVFPLHLDYIRMLHFNCIFIALDYDCMIITLRLHFYYMTFGLHFDYTMIAMMQLKCNQIAIKTQCKILLHLSCSLIAIQLHFDCMKLLHFDCIFVALHLDCKTLHLDCILITWHLDCILITPRLQFCNCTAIRVQSKCNPFLCNSGAILRHLKCNQSAMFFLCNPAAIPPQ